MSGPVSIKSLIQSCVDVIERLLCIHLGVSRTGRAAPLLNARPSRHSHTLLLLFFFSLSDKTIFGMEELTLDRGNGVDGSLAHGALKADEGLSCFVLIYRKREG